MSDEDGLDLDLGDEDKRLELASVQDNLNAVLQLAQMAKQSIYLFTYDLDPLIYDNEAFVDAVVHLARAHSRSHVHVLVQDSGRAVKRGHRLLNASHRLSSYIKLKNPPPDIGTVQHTFMVVDETGYLYRHEADRWEGLASLYDPLRSRELTHEFLGMWQRAVPDPNLTRYTL